MTVSPSMSSLAIACVSAHGHGFIGVPASALLHDI
jgi:hypothetical protein